MPLRTAVNFTISHPETDIAVLTFDAPDKGANVLSRSVLEEFDSHLKQLEDRDDLAGLILISGKPNMFIAGADLREFSASLDVGNDEVVKICRLGQSLFGRLSKCPFVTVAAIDGICIGGGAEFASWCDRRIMSDGADSEFGFPEVKLGLIPGWGGTARCSRIAGLGNAVEMITSGESIDPRTALAMGIISNIVAPDQLLSAAIQLVRLEQKTKNYLRDRQQWQAGIEVNETELGFLGVTASAYIQSQTKGNYPAPLTALDVLLGAACQEIETACQMESEGMAELFGSPINAALLNIFFLTDRNKKDTGTDRREVTPTAVKSVSVVGAGIMGAGIAASNVKRNIHTTLCDVSPDAVAQGIQYVMEEVAFNKVIKGPDVQRAVKLAPLLNGTMSDAEVATSDLIIEAIVENIEVKQQFYRRIEPQLHAEAILASNTSTIPITNLASGLKRPEQFCGIHFFNPVRRMKLVEVIRGEKTSDQTIASAVAYAKRLGKSPIVVNDGPGFLVNRLLFPYMQEALELIAEGVEIPTIERAAKKFGMPMGPIELYDMVGLDTALYAGKTMAAAFPDRVVTSLILPTLVDAGRRGRKSGSGFYSYLNRKQRAVADPSLGELIKPHLRGPKSLSQEEITTRLFMPMFLEATRVLEAEIVRDVRDVDLSLIFGIGFPPFKGGLLFWADTQGASALIERLKPFEPLGTRFEPTKVLKQMATDKSKFYA